MNDRLWHIIQTADSTFPVGGFAHSYGLEGMVQNGFINNAGELFAAIQKTWIPVLTRVDFPLVRHSHTYAHDDEILYRIDQLAWASRATAESRRAQQQMGQQRLKMVSQLTGNARLQELLEAAACQQWMANWPSVCGVESACTQQVIDDSLLAYGYQFLNGILAASSKLIRIGPTEIQRLLFQCEREVRQSIAKSQFITEDEIGWFSPLLDITGSNHEHAYSRLFIS